MVRRLHEISRLTGWESARQIAEGCESAWTKAASFGRGPSYVRPAGIGVGGEAPSIWSRPRRIDRRIQEVENDETKIVLAKGERAHYALGLLGVERDLDKLNFEDEIADR